MPNSDVQCPNDGPFDIRIFPPRWAYPDLSDEEYEVQKAVYESVSTTEAEIISLKNEQKAFLI